SQKKAYLHCDDLLHGMLHIEAHAPERLAYYNIGPADEGVTVQFIAEEVVSAFSPGAEIQYGLGSKGWPGDVPKFAYSIGKLRALGGTPSRSSAEAVRRAVREVVEQEAAR